MNITLKFCIFIILGSFLFPLSSSAQSYVYETNTIEYGRCEILIEPRLSLTGAVNVTRLTHSTKSVNCNAGSLFFPSDLTYDSVSRSIVFEDEDTTLYFISFQPANPHIIEERGGPFEVWYYCDCGDSKLPGNCVSTIDNYGHLQTFDCIADGECTAGCKGYVKYEKSNRGIVEIPYGGVIFRATKTFNIFKIEDD